MYFCKIYLNVKRNEATTIYSFHVYTLLYQYLGPSGETALWIGPKCNTKCLQRKIHLHAKFELNRMKIVDARARHSDIHTHTHIHTHTFRKI